LGVYGPLYLLSLAALLVLIDPLRHVLQDAGVWDGPSSNMFVDDESCGEGWKCLTLTGWLCVATTYLGFASMFVAAAWNGNLLAKWRMFKRQWHEVRAEHAAAELAEANQSREEAARAREEAARARNAAIAASVAAKPPSFNHMHVAMTPPTFLYRAEEGNRHGRVGHITTGLSSGSGSGATASSSSSSSSSSGAGSPNATGNRHSRRENHSSSAVMSPATGSPNSTIAAENAAAAATTNATRATPAEYAPEGFSFEVKTPALVESVIKVSPSTAISSSSRSSSSSSRSRGGSSAEAAARGPTVAGAASPTVVTVSGTPSVSGHSTNGNGAANQQQLHASYPSPLSSVGGLSQCSFADVSLTPVSKGVVAPASSPASSCSVGVANQHLSSPPPSSSGKMYARSHVPGALASPPASTDLSPRTGPTVKQKFEDLRAAALPFDKQKWQQQQQEQPR
jgi:hypothetical protein